MWARRQLTGTPDLPLPRIRHTAGVARRAAAAGAVLLSSEQAELVRAAAWLHDIGYAPGLVDTGCHSIDGARHLRKLGAPDELVGLVAYHSGAVYEAAERGLLEELAAFSRPPDELLDVVTFADMSTDVDGHEASVKSRLAGIFERYSADDPVRVSVDAAATYLLGAVQRVENRLAAT